MLAKLFPRPGEIGNYLFIPLALIMLVLALRERRA